MTAAFVCAICGETHAGLVADWAYTLPDEVYALSPSERAARATFDSDLCRLDDRHFIRAVLPVPLLDQDGVFGWGAWAEVERATFDRYLDLYDVDGSNEPPHPGTLANDLPVYGRTIGTPVRIQFRDPTSRPTLHTLPDDPAPLAREQRHGIDAARHHAIVARLTG